MFDFVYDRLIHIVPRWLWWVLMIPLILFLAYILAANYWPERF